MPTHELGSNKCWPCPNLPEDYDRFTCGVLEGQAVPILVNTEKEVGIYPITWAAEHQSTGLYCVLMQTEHFSQINIMLLIR